MLDINSPLGPDAKFQTDSVTLREDSDFTLTQIAGDEAALKKSAGALPDMVGVVFSTKSRTVFRIAPKQAWVLGDAPKAADGIYLTPLSSGRTRIVLEGEGARKVLSRSAQFDFHPKSFVAGRFIMTGIHHTPVLIHCTAENTFHIYALRTFAQNVWEWLVDAAGQN